MRAGGLIAALIGGAIALAFAILIADLLRKLQEAGRPIGRT